MTQTEREKGRQKHQTIEYNKFRVNREKEVESKKKKIENQREEHIDHNREIQKGTN